MCCIPLSHRVLPGHHEQLKARMQNAEQQRELPGAAPSWVSTTALLALNKGKTLQLTCRSSTIKFESILKKYFQEVDPFIYSRMIFGSTHDSHFHSPFSSFFWTISWLILQIKHRSVFFFFFPKSKDKDEWKFKVAKLSHGLEVASFSDTPRQTAMAPEVLCYLIWTMRVAVNEDSSKRKTSNNKKC